MSASTVTPEEKSFISDQFVIAQRFDNCVQCGQQIDSARQIEFPETDTCGRKNCGAIDMHEEER